MYPMQVWGPYCSVEAHQLGGETATAATSPSLCDAQASLGIAGKDLGRGSARGKRVARMDGTSRTGVQQG